VPITNKANSTNTDGVILDPSRSQESDRGIVAWKKSSTTKNPSDGINNVISESESIVVPVGFVVECMH
jgi:hypothetical protein